MDNLEIDIGREMEAICDSVSGRAMQAQLPKDTMLNGKTLIVDPLLIEGKSFHGDAEEMRKFIFTGNSKEAHIFSNYCSQSNGKIVLTKWDGDRHSEKAIVAIGGTQVFLQGKEYRDTRKMYYKLFVEMTRKNANLLLKIVSNKPELIEKFYQTVFKDLDSKENEDTGLRREKTDNLEILDIKEVLEIVGTVSVLNQYCLDKIAKISVLKKLPKKIGVREQS